MLAGFEANDAQNLYHVMKSSHETTMPRRYHWQKHLANTGTTSLLPVALNSEEEIRESN